MQYLFRNERQNPELIIANQLRPFSMSVSYLFLFIFNSINCYFYELTGNDGNKYCRRARLWAAATWQ